MLAPLQLSPGLQGLGPMGLSPSPLGAGQALAGKSLMGGAQNLQDLAKLSKELIQKKQAEDKLRQGVKAVMAAQKAGQNPEAAKQALAKDYVGTKSKGIEIDPFLDKAVKALVGDQIAKANQEALNGGANGAGGLGGANGGGGGLGGGGGAGSLLNGLNDNFGGGGGGMGFTNLNGGGGFGGGGGQVHSAKPLGDLDHQNISEASRQGQFPDLISGFRQTREGNCASVAAIKAAMKEYGGGVFRNVSRGENGYEIELQNGRKVQLSNEELAYARGQAQFAGNDPKALAFGELCYGVIAKEHASRHGVGLRESCFDLNNGFDPRDSARLLGLGNRMTAFNGVNGAIWNNRHAVAKIDGADDMWGRPGRFGGNQGFSFERGMPSQTWTVNGDQGGSNGVQPAQEPQASPPVQEPQASASTQDSGQGDEPQLAQSQELPEENSSSALEGLGDETQLASSESVEEPSAGEDLGAGGEEPGGETMLASNDAPAEEPAPEPAAPPQEETAVA